MPPAHQSTTVGDRGSSKKLGKRRRQDDEFEDNVDLQENDVVEDGAEDEDEGEAGSSDSVKGAQEDDSTENAKSGNAVASSSKTPSKKKRTPVPGVIYISRVPPGMTPQKIKYLMSRWGAVGKLYAQKRGGQFSGAASEYC
jgi:hypothetical protein